MQGRTAVLTEYFKPLELREYTVPDPEPGAIVLRMRLAGLCGSDLHTWRGDNASVPLPAGGKPMGHEGVGMVHSLGAGVSTDFLGQTIREGDRLVFPAVFSCGRCVCCAGGDTNLCSQWRLTYRASGGEAPYFVNTFSDFTYLPAGHPVFKVPDPLADEEVVALNCAMGTVLQGLTLAETRQGDSVVVQGAGGLGQYAIAFARHLGAGNIIAIDGQSARLDLARRMGATHTIDINEAKTSAERIDRVRDITGKRGADVVLELVGLGELVQEGIGMLAADGAFVEIGNIMRGRTATIEPRSLLPRRKIFGSSMYRPSIIPAMLDFLMRNHESLPIRDVISHKFTLSKINEAFGEAEWSGRVSPVIRGAVVP